MNGDSSLSTFQSSDPLREQGGIGMKIAVGSEDGTTITQHLGRAPLYVVFTVEDGKIVSKETRDKKSYKPPDPSRGETCGPDGCPHPGHESMADIISDCQVLLTGGIGWGAYQTMQDRGIDPVVTEATDIDEAVQLYLEGKLAG